MKVRQELDRCIRPRVLTTFALKPLSGHIRSFQASDWLRASNVSPDPRDGVVRFVDHPVQLVTADQAVTEQLRGRELLIGQ